MKRLKILFLLLLITSVIKAQNTQVSGVVLQATDNEPVIGATIIVPGTSIGTVTGYDGRFTLDVPSSYKTLQVSYLGMKTQEVGVQSIIRVLLEDNTQELGEVFVVAYGTSTKKSFTGSAAVVKSDVISRTQSATVTSVLEGTTAGVQLVNATGQPGENPTVRIRGIGSINASKDPLYIVDGATYDGPISALNPADIESLTVLKDAAANSLYGARGANGVILITTKRNNKSKAGITLDARWGINSRATREYDIIRNPGTYYEQAWKAQYNLLAAANSNYSDSDIKNILADSSNENSLSAVLGGYNSYNVPFSELITADGKLNPNARLLYNDSWEDELFKNSLRQEYNFSIGNSTDKQSYYIGLGYLNDDSYMKKSDFERYSGRIRFEKNVTGWLKAGGALFYSHSVQNYPRSSGGNYVNSFMWSRQIAPIYPVFLRDPSTGEKITDANGNSLYDYGERGDLGYSRPYAPNYNPVGLVEYDTNKIVQDIVTGTAFLEATVYKGLSVKGNIDVNTSFKNTSQLNNPFYGDAVPTKGSVMKQNERWFSYTGSAFVNYNETFGDFRVDFLAGTESHKKEYNYLYGYKRGLAFPDVAEFGNAVVYSDLNSYTQTYSVTGYLTRLNVSYADKYYISGSYRRDGSSRFDPDNRWGNFGSLGLSWRIDQEDFFKQVKFINDLRIKASIGSQGNDNLLYANSSDSNYIPYLDQYEVTNKDDNVSIKQVYIGNRNITWEKSINSNIGFETRLFDRVNINFEYFNKQTKDMLFYRPLALSTGIASYPVNLGKIRNSGVEVELDVDIIRNKDFNWNMGINLSHIKNKIITLPEENREKGIFATGYTKLIEGGSIYDIYLPEFAGITEEGLASWNVYDEKGILTGTTTVHSDAYTEESRRNVGTALPDLTGGISTNLQWKEFDLSVVLSFQLGGKVLDEVYRSLFQLDAEAYGQGWHQDILNAWTESNRQTDVPKLMYGYKDANAVSDYFLIDASYLNLRNISFGYRLPGSILQKTGVGSARFYITGDNLALFSKRKGLDPRQYDYGTTGFNYSPIRTISFGINITL